MATSHKYIIPVAVLAVALLTLTGTAYAYSAYYTDHDSQKEISEDFYFIVNDGALVSSSAELNFTGDTHAVKDGETWKYTYDNIKFTDKTSGAVVTKVTYTLKVQLVKQDGTAVSGATITGTATAADLASGKTSAVVNCVAPSATTDADGKCTVVFTATLIGSAAAEKGCDYVVPAYTFDLKYDYPSA